MTYRGSDTVVAVEDLPAQGLQRGDPVAAASLVPSSTAAIRTDPCGWAAASASQEHGICDEGGDQLQHPEGGWIERHHDHRPPIATVVPVVHHGSGRELQQEQRKQGESPRKAEGGLHPGGRGG